MDSKKIFLVLLLGIFMISLVSAWDFDNVKDEVSETFDNITAVDNPILNDYPAIKITNSLGLGEVLFEGYISEHDYNCGRKCETVIKVKVPDNTNLVDEVIFRTYTNREWVEQDIRDYEFYTYREGKEIVVEDYDFECSSNLDKNGTLVNTCEEVLIGTHTEKEENWIKYELGTEMPEGVYTLKLVGNKRPDRIVDFIIKTNGEWLEEWAIWGAENGLAGYWSFDETSGTNVKDYTDGSLHNGTVDNITDAQWLSGSNCLKLGCLNLSEANDYVWIGTDRSNGYDDYNNLGTDEFSLSFWMYAFNDFGGDAGVIGKWIDNENGDPWQISSDGTQFYTRMDGDLKGGTTSGVTKNTWQHVVVVSNTTGLMYFINGEYLTIEPYDDPATNDSAIKIGTYAGYDFGQNGNFTIDELGLWNVSLGEDDISDLYNGGDGLGYGDNSSITLNSPDNEEISESNLVTFNITAKTVGGAYIKNMSLWTNETGSWAEYNLTESFSTDFDYENDANLENLYFLNDNDLTDSEGSLDGTDSGTGNISGAIDSARYFDNNATINFSATSYIANVSYSFWIYFNNTYEDFSITDGSAIYERIGGGGGDHEAITLQNNEIMYRFGDDTGSTTKYLTVGSPLENDTWHHIVVTGWGDGNVGAYQIWIDGENQTISYGAQGVVRTRPATSIESFFGSAIAKGSFIGSLDHFMIFNDALSEEEIEDLYLEGGRLKTSTKTWVRDIDEERIIWAGHMCDTDNVCQFSLVNRTLFIDADPPTISVTSPVSSNNFIALGENFTLNTTITDDNLDTCIYDYNGTNFTIDGCTSGVLNSTQIPIEEDNYNITIYVNDTVGNTNYTNVDWDYIVFQTNSSYNNETTEGNTERFSVNVTWLNDTYNDINAYLNYNGTRQSIATRSLSGNKANFTTSIAIPSVNEDTNVTFLWEFLLEGSYYNSTGTNQTIQNINIDDCSVYTYVLFNFTMFDEEEVVYLNDSNVTLLDAELILKDGSETIMNYSNQYSNENPSLICSEINLSNASYNYDLVLSFRSLDHVNEFYFVDEGVLDSSTIYNNISLYNLKSADSTSFLFNFYDENRLKIENSVVRVMRKYVGSGLFREVERAKADQNGDTIIHLVEEDVIYYFIITLDGVVQYTSEQYTALCQEVPCTITINQGGDSAIFGTDWDLVDGGSYALYSNRVARTVTLNYSLEDSGTFNLTVYKYENDGSFSAVNTSESTGTSGSIQVSVPLTSGNTTFFTSIFKDDAFIKSAWVDFSTMSKDRFGTTLALFLALLIVLTLGLMAVSEGVLTIVMVILGVAIAGFMGLTELSFGTGVNIIIYLVLAGGILIWKLTSGGKN